MADYMGDLIREHINGLARLPQASDEAAICALEREVLDRMSAQGIDQADIEQQLGRLCDVIRNEIVRRTPPG